MHSYWDTVTVIDIVETTMRPTVSQKELQSTKKLFQAISIMGRCQERTIAQEEPHIKHKRFNEGVVFGWFWFQDTVHWVHFIILCVEQT